LCPSSVYQLKDKEHRYHIKKSHALGEENLFLSKQICKIILWTGALSETA
jgi:hypothetical protein